MAQEAPPPESKNLNQASASLISGIASDAPAPAPTSASTTTANFIGPAGYELPDTYRVGAGTTGGPANYALDLPQITPRYAVGDELIPLKESWTPEHIAEIQNQMVASGLLKPRDYQLGFWDKPTMAAYRELLGYSNVSGQDYSTTLANFKATIAKFGDTTTGATRVRQPFISELTDPNTLRDTLDAVSVRTMGRGLTEEEKAHFVDSFRATQDASNRKKYDLAGDIDTTTGAYTGTGGQYDVPNPESSATAFVKATNPDAVKEYNYLNAFKAFQGLLSGSGIS